MSESQGMLFTQPVHADALDPRGPSGPVVPAAHNATPTSTEAAHRADDAGVTAMLQSMVFGALHSVGHDGYTCRELAALLTERRGKLTEQASVTGRLNPPWGWPAWAIKTARTRGGGAVWVHRLHAVNCPECRPSILAWEGERRAAAAKRAAGGAA